MDRVMATTHGGLAMKKKRREISLPSEKYVYRVEVCKNDQWEVQSYRVQKKVKMPLGKRKTISSTFPTLSEALAYRSTLTEDFFALNYDSFTKLKRSKFKDVFDRFIQHKEYEAGLQPTTIQKYRQTGQHLIFFNDLYFDQITSQAVDLWINFLRDPDYLACQKNRRINYRHEFDLFRGVVSYYTEFENEDYQNPILQRHRKRLCSRPRNSKKEIKFLSPIQYDGLLNHLKSEESILASMMIVQVETGMRISEVAALQRSQLSLSKREVFIDHHLQWDRAKGGKTTLAKGTKSGGSRVVYMTQLCEKTLRDLIRNSDGDKLFHSNQEWISYRTIQHFYKKALKGVGAKAFGTHTLRHTFAVNFLRRTKDIHALQKLLGHADLSDTQTYAKYTDESTRRSFEIFDCGETNVIAGKFGSQSGS